MVPEALHRLIRKCEPGSEMRQAFEAYVKARDAEAGLPAAGDGETTDAARKAYTDLLAAIPRSAAEALFKSILALDFARRNSLPPHRALLDLWIHQVATVALDDRLLPPHPGGNG